MSGDVAGLDIRVPIGALFAVLGVILVAYGVATNGDAAQYARSGGFNINLWWGAVMLVFGVALLVASRPKRGAPGGAPGGGGSGRA
jgi:hypothetical protein